MIEKTQYFESFKDSVAQCTEYSERKLNRKIPSNVRCLIGLPEFYEKALTDGSVKYLGGRFLKPEGLINLSVQDAAELTYVDGKVPTWVNLYFEGYNDKYSYVRVLTSQSVTDDIEKIYDMPDGGKQFRLFVSGIGVSGQGGLPDDFLNE